MALEALLGLPVAFKGDIYSLGLILHFILTKKLANYIVNVKHFMYEIPSEYSQDIKDLMLMILKKNTA